jgi:pectate lyase
MPSSPSVSSRRRRIALSPSILALVLIVAGSSVAVGQVLPSGAPESATAGRRADRMSDPGDPAWVDTGARLLGVGERQYGYAEWRGITGGLGHEPYVVTSAADRGPGTYRDALAEGNRYITFASELDGSVIRLDDDVTTDASDITIDASGRDITVSRFATKFSGTNVVIAGMTYRDMDGSGNEDAITFRDASREQVFALYGNTFESATDGLVDVIWNRGNDVYGTICGNQFLRHDKAMLIHSGDQAYEGGRYHITVCENRWVDVYQRAPFTRDARVHQYNDVFERYGKPDGAGGGSKSGAESQRSQHLLQNNIAFPRRAGEVTWTGDVVTTPRAEYAGPQWGSSGSIRVDGSLLLSNGSATASELEQNPGEVAAPPYRVGVMPADAHTKAAVEGNAGSCAPTPYRSANPCAPVVAAPGGVVAVEVDWTATKVVVRLDGNAAVEARPVGGGRWEATLPSGHVGWVDAVVTDQHGAIHSTNRAVVIAR